MNPRNKAKRRRWEYLTMKRNPPVCLTLRLAEDPDTGVIMEHHEGILKSGRPFHTVSVFIGGITTGNCPFPLL